MTLTTPAGDSPVLALSAAAADHRMAVSGLIDARNVTHRLLFSDWFGDLAWDVMLCLYLAHLDERPFLETDMPARGVHSVRRWTRLMEVEGLAERAGDGHRLSDRGTEIMRQYFEQIALL